MNEWPKTPNDKLRRELPIPISEADLAMYEVSGLGKISDKSMGRYFRDKERYDSEIQELSTNIALRIERGLDSSDPEIINLMMDDIWKLPDEDQKRLEEKAQKRREEIKTASRTGKKPDVAGMPSSLMTKDRIFEALQSDDLEIARAGARMLKYAEGSNEELFHLAMIAIQNLDDDVARAGVRFVGLKTGDSSWGLKRKFNTRSDYHTRLLEAVQSRGLVDEYIKADDLYEQMDEEYKHKFGRHMFASKQGFDMRVLTGELADKTIMRTLIPRNFLPWQRAFESYATWKEAGFDYVPIEPIQSFKLRHDGMIDVYATVLDLDLYAWEDKVGTFMEELEQDKENIKETLEKIGVRHGDIPGMHKNFVVRVFRDENGKPDLTKKPKLYQ